MRELRHFAPQEFRGWYERMDARLLTLLDDFRDQLGEPVIDISSARIYRAPSRSG